MDLEKLKTDQTLLSQVAADEGVKATPYRDTRGNWTGGIGHNLSAHGVAWSKIAIWLKTGIPDGTIKEWFSEDIGDAVQCSDQVFSSFGDLPDEAQRVLVNMAFDLMYELHEWYDLKEHLLEKNWKGAASDILRSDFALEDPDRCRRLAAGMAALA